MFVLQYVQPGLAGLMDGSVSTLAPLFAAAFATHNTWATFLVGLAAAIGAGISMGFAEALSDDGSLTGRGAPVVRGAVCGAMTARRRPRPRAALSHSAFLRGDRARVCRRRGRTGRHLLDPHPLYGYAVPAGGLPGRRRRRARLCRRHSHRQFVIVAARAHQKIFGTSLIRTHDAAMFALAHLSDLHLAARPRPLDLLGKRGLGFINWHRGRKYMFRQRRA